jgi:hypothetical protein
MIKKLLLLLFITNSVHASHIPKEGETESNNRYTFRYFHKFTPKVRSLVEYDYKSSEFMSDEQAIKIGARYRLTKNFKLGAFYERASGLRHDDDWIWTPSGWIWRDTENRNETIILLEASYRNRLLDLDNTLYELRYTNHFNHFNDHNTAKLRLGLTHIISGDSSPLLNLYAHYEMYLATNFGDKLLYENWLYTGLLYHFNSVIKPGIFYNYRSGTWTTSQDSKDRNQSSYEVDHSAHYLGLNLNIYY